MADKKLSISKLDKLLKAKQSEPVNLIKYEFEQETIEIPVKRYINLDETIGFVNGIVNSVFQIDDDGNEFYAPEILDYAKALHYIEYFCPTLKLELGSDRVFSMLYSTEIMRDIYKHISPAQYNHLEDSIDAAIAYKLSILASGERSKIEKAITQIEAAGQALEALTAQFSGIDEEKMQAAIENIATLSPEKMVGAVVDIRDITKK
ncbi:hypothetical protein SDC9_41249 [bioreactor metagenome]|uniref:Uncharacterized protein n=1 Tax=bioreactor metagenome TaxID=1076179 RepID=A0A644VUR9_9ZZZZ